MDELTAPEKVVEWAGALLEIPAERRDTHRQLYKDSPGLPDVVAVIRESRVQSGPDGQDFPFAELQQVYLVVFIVELSIVVPRPENEESAAERQDQLSEFARKLRSSIVADATLGGRVEMASPLVTFAFEPQEVQLPDGSQGWAVFCDVKVAERMPEP